MPAEGVDSGYLDWEGHLYVSDRIKEMIASDGEDVYPTEALSIVTPQYGPLIQRSCNYALLDEGSILSTPCARLLMYSSVR